MKILGESLSKQDKKNLKYIFSADNWGKEMENKWLKVNQKDTLKLIYVKENIYEVYFRYARSHPFGGFYEKESHTIIEVTK